MIKQLNVTESKEVTEPSVLGVFQILTNISSINCITSNKIIISGFIFLFEK